MADIKGKITTWWKKPVKTKTNGSAVITAFIEGLGNQLRNNKISQLEKRIAALEQGRTSRRLSDAEIQAFVKNVFDKRKS